MKKTGLLLIILSIIFSHCSVKEESSGENEIFITHQNVEGRFADLIESYEVVVFDDDVEAFFRNHGNIIVTDSNIIIAEPNEPPSILLFDSKGGFIRTIGHAGRGPGEMTRIGDIAFDQEKELLMVFHNEKVLVFDLNGNLIDEKTLTFRPDKVLRYGNGYVVEKMIASDDPESDYMIRIVDEEFNSVASRRPLEYIELMGHMFMGQGKRMMINGDHLYYFSVEGDTVYHIKDDVIEPAYSLSYEKEILILSRFRSAADFPGATGVMGRDSYRGISYFETGSLSLIIFSYDGKAYCQLFDSQDGSTTLLEGAFRLQTIHDGKGIVITGLSNFEEMLNERIDPEREKCLNPDLLEEILSDSQRDTHVMLKIKFVNELR